MILQCPGCDKRYRLDDSRLSGGDVQVRCSSCQTVFNSSQLETSVEERPASADPTPGHNNILVCDDASFFRTMLDDILTEAGFSVTTASSGEEAVSIVSSHQPDLLILDLQLPGISGFEVIKRIRQEEGRRVMPILAMSGVFTDSSDVMTLEDVGADDYIGKKFTPEHLVKRVRRLLGVPAEGG